MVLKSRSSMAKAKVARNRGQVNLYIKYQGIAKNVIARKDAILFALQEKFEADRLKDQKLRDRSAMLHHLVFPDNLFHAWHLQEYAELLFVHEQEEEEIIKKPLDGLAGYERMRAVVDAALDNLADADWEKFVVTLSHFHVDDALMMRTLMQELPAFTDLINQDQDQDDDERPEPPRYAYLSASGMTEAFYNFMDNAGWHELKFGGKNSISQPQASIKSTKSWKSASSKGDSLKVPLPAAYTLESILSIDESVRSVSIVFLDLCPSLEADSYMDPRGAGLSYDDVPDFRHLGLTCSGNSAKMLTYLDHSLRKTLRILKPNGSIVLTWGAFTGHPTLLFLKKLLDPLFETITLLALPRTCTSFETVALFNNFIPMEIEDDCDEEVEVENESSLTPEYEFAMAFLEGIQREEGVDDILLWSLTDEEMREELESSDDLELVLDSIGEKMLQTYKTLLKLARINALQLKKPPRKTKKESSIRKSGSKRLSR